MASELNAEVKATQSIEHMSIEDLCDVLHDKIITLSNKHEGVVSSIRTTVDQKFAGAIRPIVGDFDIDLIEKDLNLKLKSTEDGAKKTPPPSERSPLAESILGAINKLSRLNLKIIDDRDALITMIEEKFERV